MRPFLGVLVLSILVSAAVAGTETNNAAVWFLISVGSVSDEDPQTFKSTVSPKFRSYCSFLFSALPERSVLRPPFFYLVGLGCSNSDGVFDGKKKI